MLGIKGPQIWIAYVLCFLSAIGCIIYGALKWNEGSEEDACGIVRTTARPEEEAY
ncbi:MAG: hypothetical protein SCH66_06600 [Methanolobus sp.]|nr:hypothetical protein [Methanolobus sp.]